MKTKKFLSIILLLMILIMSLPINVVNATSGTQGKIKWSINTNGQLIINSSSGQNVPIPNFTTSDKPEWYKHRADIKEIVIKSSITTIGEYAFYNLSKAKSITIYEDVNTINPSAFNGCVKVSSVELKNNKNFVVTGNVIYTADYKKLVYYPAGKKADTFTCKSNTTSIQGFAFTDNIYLKNITLPNVKVISGAAFKNCTNLTNVNLSTNLTTLGNKVFTDCKNISKVELTPLVTSIGIDCFEKGTKIIGAKNSYAQSYASENKLSFGEKKYYFYLQLMNDSKQYKKITCTYNYPVGSLPKLEKTGYDFSGWYLGNTKFTESTVFTQFKDISLISKFTPKNYTVTFNANGGTCSTNSKQVSYKSKFGNLPIPTLNEYVFKGWYTTSGTYVDSQTVLNTPSDLTLIAKYSGADYTLTLNSNGGVCNDSTYKVTYGTIYGNLPQPTKKGYIFAGWFTVANPTDINSKIKNNDLFNDKSINTLYAYWIPSIKQVENLKLKYLDKNSIKASWNKVNNANGYEVYYRASGNKYKLFKKTASTEIKLTKLNMKKQYFIKVRANSININKITYGAFSKTVKREKTYISAPKVKIKFNKSSKIMQLKWNKVTSAQKYEIRMYRNGKIKKIKTSSNACAVKTTVGCTYRFKIRAYKNVLGHKVYSKFTTVKRKV